MQDDLIMSKNSQFDVEIFRRDALKINEEALIVHKSFSELLDSVQDIYSHLVNNEETINQQREELVSVADIHEGISENQKRYVGITSIKQFTSLELKKFKFSLSSGELLMDEAHNIIIEAKKDCDKIYGALQKLISEAGLPFMEGSDANMFSTSKSDAFKRRYFTRKEAIKQMVNDGQGDLKAFLIDETKAQAMIKTQTASTETNLKKNIIRNMCKAELNLENHRPENLAPFIEASDQWKEFLDRMETRQIEKGESRKLVETQAPSILVPGTCGSLQKEAV